MLGGGAARALTNAFPQGLSETLPPRGSASRGFSLAEPLDAVTVRS
jgi:hypothetical protein